MKQGRDILSGYGPESARDQKPRATNGGNMGERDVMNYAAPKGPMGIMQPAKPGLGGTNLGNGQKFDHTKCSAAGRPGLGGDNSGIANKPKL